MRNARWVSILILTAAAFTGSSAFGQKPENGDPEIAVEWKWATDTTKAIFSITNNSGKPIAIHQTIKYFFISADKNIDIHQYSADQLQLAREFNDTFSPIDFEDGRIYCLLEFVAPNNSQLPIGILMNSGGVEAVPRVIAPGKTVDITMDVPAGMLNTAKQCEKARLEFASTQKVYFKSLLHYVQGVWVASKSEK